ncbi:MULTISPECIES: glycosyltransferase family 2 protein [unclassified Methanoregula]|uniref:glycosyltransferase family 2 protein n=1 Tax=unclassified Methanoregula TaxID=2649730 RepID=UPI0009CA8450|nr:MULTISPECIES: glycosyltransferase family 2 protein [unclassified Methanoregula]OPX65130.1 MAG: Glycosyltransferase AglI [Methanoregula sp. PtaB.Bin085]OPY32042.1 MAG: Glycosyltransferase AglI [Methanoregula sp. PtaU1.Bin006]
MQNNTEYSIVVPVFNSEKSLEELLTRLNRLFHPISESYEIILVDDRSIDSSWDILKRLHADNSKIKIIRLIRNFGQHNALLAGLNICTGKIIITLDDDLQHPPEEIPKLIAKLKEGFFVVYGKYPPENDSRIENFLSRLYQKIIHIILDIPQEIFISSFVIYQREIVQNIITIKSSYPFLPAMTVRSAPVSKITNVDVAHQKRKKGSSNYGLIRYFKYSLNLIINYSSMPLVFVASLGILLSIFSIFFGFWIIIQKIINPSYGIMGWNSLMVAICFLGGAILMSMGILGEYLRRILAETSYGQQYVISEIDA